MTNDIPRFHYAFPVTDLEKTRQFYTEIMGCAEGRANDHWIDFNFHGHQIVAHLSPEKPQAIYNDVDKDKVPVPHFGVILTWDEWHKLGDRLKAANVNFVIEPKMRFKANKGEQGTMFLLDPSGNAIEIKCFKHDKQVFEK